MFRYSYFITSLFFLVVWLLVYWRAGTLRRPMLVLSVITALFGPISEIWYFADYWKPEIAFPLPGVGGVEDLIFGFAIGGIAAFGYESLFVKKFCLCRPKKGREWFLLIFAAIVGASMLVLNNLLGLNSVYASSIGMIIAASIMLYFRRDLIIHAVGSAVLVMLTMFAIYYLGQTFFPNAHFWMERIWKLSGTPQGVVIFRHIPWTEMLWGFSWGLVWGPMYEFLIGARAIKIKF